MKKALLIVDVQNDFCENGNLAVPEANSIIPYINSLIANNNYDEIILSQDYHPNNHKSFASVNHKNIGEEIILNGLPQIMWPDHCVQGSFGAEFHALLNTKSATKIIQKGLNIEVDSYSAFYDNNKEISTGLSDYLKDKNIKTLEVTGLALDYCVKYSCLDAVKEGFETFLHFKGTKAVNIKDDDTKDSLYELILNGINIIA